MIETSCRNCNSRCNEIFFSGVNQSDEQVENSRIILFKKGETLFKQNTTVSSLMLIRKGLVKLVMEGSSGRNYILEILGAGEFIGFDHIINNQYADYTVLALNHVEVCLISLSHINKLIKSDKNIMYNILKLYDEDYKQLKKRLHVLGTKNLHGRLAETLIYLNDKSLLKQKIFSFITRRDIAEFSAMSLESMNRLLSEFKNDKIITIQGKEIKINDQKLINLIRQVG